MISLSLVERMVLLIYYLNFWDRIRSSEIELGPQGISSKDGQSALLVTRWSSVIGQKMVVIELSINRIFQNMKSEQWDTVQIKSLQETIGILIYGKDKRAPIPSTLNFGN